MKMVNLSLCLSHYLVAVWHSIQFYPEKDVSSSDDNTLSPEDYEITKKFEMARIMIFALVTFIIGNTI